MVDRTQRPIVPTAHADSAEHRRLLAVRANASLPKDGSEGMTGPLRRMAPVTKTGNFTVADNENWIINNKSGSACTVTLPAAGIWIGREIMFTNNQAQQLNSASSNVVPLVGGSAGTAILSANAGRWATLVSDGSSWHITQGVI